MIKFFYLKMDIQIKLSVGSCNGDFDLDEIIKNTNNNIKNFLNLKESDYDNLKVELFKRIRKKKYMVITK